MSAARSAAAWLLAMVAFAAGAAAQMPDARQMSGIPMPTGDVPPGTIVVRVVRGDISNNIPNQDVELHVGGRVLTARTDENGRATFSGVEPGADAHAIAVVDGERLESSHIQLGPSGGVRVMLAAGVGAGSGTATGGVSPPAGTSIPAVEGEVAFGGQSRIQIEFDDDQMEVFYLFEIVNRGSAPVTPPRELAFELPEGAESPTLLEGSSTQAAVRGRQVSIAGPFAPGSTPVQIGFGLAGGTAERILRQTLPATWEQVQVIVSRVGSVQAASDQFSSNTAMPNEGHDFILGSGPALAAGSELRVTLSGLPYRSRAGRWFAIVLALTLLGIGAWGAYGGRTPTAADARRSQLEVRRQKLMADLARLEDQQRQGTLESGRYGARRQDVISQLERVYGELDQQSGAAGAD